MRKLRLLCLFACLLVPAASASAGNISGTITLDQASPTVGSTVTFTTTLNAGANVVEGVQVSCYVGDPAKGLLVYVSEQLPYDGGGFVLTPNYDANLYPGGDLNCIATLEAIRNHQTIEVAQVVFTATG